MRRQSAKARRVTAALAAYRGQPCQGTKLPGPCEGQTVAHHVCQRSVRPDLVLDPSNLLVLCRFHHQWVHDHPHLAHELGYLKHSWEVA